MSFFDTEAWRERMDERWFDTGVAMAEAGAVDLVSIEDEGEPATQPSVQHLADYLMNVHSVATSPLVLPAADSPAQQLVDLYKDVGADLLVMGAYSHSRLQRLFFGDFTGILFNNLRPPRPAEALLAVLQLAADAIIHGRIVL